MTIRSGVLLLLLWVSARGDTLILRDGTRVTGRWWANDANLISFLVNDRLERYSRAEVSEVVFGTVPGSMVAAPDQIGAIYFQKNSGDLLPLERTPRSGVVDSGNAWDLRGPRSAIRLKSDSKMLFVVDVPSGTNPSAFSLYPLETRENTRQTKAGGGNGSTITIPFTSTKVAGNTYVLAPTNGLGPGEYSFPSTNSTDAFCFGIDPDAPGAPRSR